MRAASALAVCLMNGVVTTVHGLAASLGAQLEADTHGNESLAAAGHPVLRIFHISKTSGTALHWALRKHVDEKKVQMCSHAETRHAMLHWVPSKPPTDYVFFLRAPVHRFTAGWLSRYRQGAPAHFSPWTPMETEAFTRFVTPDDLACALTARDPKTKRDAERIMNSLQHLSWSMTWMLGGMDVLKRASSSIAFVGRAEHFGKDYKLLVQMMRKRGLFVSPPPETVPRMHANPNDLDDMKILSRCSVQNLREWYKKDYNLIKYLASNGYMDSSYPKEVDKLDAPPQAGQKRKFFVTA